MDWHKEKAVFYTAFSLPTKIFTLNFREVQHSMEVHHDRQSKWLGTSTCRLWLDHCQYCLSPAWPQNLLQEFIWQEYDMFPRFPVLKRFLAFWEEEIEGPLHSVTVAHQQLIKPSDFRHCDGQFTLQWHSVCEKIRRHSAGFCLLIKRLFC